MSEFRHTILIYSNAIFSSEALAKANQEGFELIYSKGKSRLIDEILSNRPFAVLIDGDYVGQRSMKPAFLLQKIRHVVRSTPVFLFNSFETDHVKLMAEELVYAVVSGNPDLSKLIDVIKKYISTPKRGAQSDKVRNKVQVPCLLKKLGTSGVLSGKICDLSPKGMKIILDKPCDEWSAGDEIRFSIPRKNDSSSHLDGYGHLRWSQKQNVGQGFVNVQLGVEFTQLPLPTLYEFLDLLNSSRAAA